MNGRTGQSTVEYAVLLVVVIAALLAVSIFMKRGVMGKARESTDQVGEQFAPLTTSNDYTRTFKSKRTERAQMDGMAFSTIVEPEVQNRTGNEDLTENLKDEKLFK